MKEGRVSVSLRMSCSKREWEIVSLAPDRLWAFRRDCTPCAVVFMGSCVTKFAKVLVVVVG